MEREEKKFYGRKIESVLKMNGCETAAKYSMLSIHPDQLPAERSTYRDNIYALHGRLFGQMCAPDEIVVSYGITISDPARRGEKLSQKDGFFFYWKTDVG